MSIIHNALKKTQENLNETGDSKKVSDKKSEPSSSVISTASEKEQQTQTNKKTEMPVIKNKRRSNKSFLLLVALLAFLPIIANQFIWKSTNEQLNTSSPELFKLTKSLSESMAQKKSVESQITPTQKASTIQNKKDLHVSGVVTAGHQKMAIINDKIYEIGEVINDMTIINITMKKIELLKGEDIIRLPVVEK